MPECGGIRFSARWSRDLARSPTGRPHAHIKSASIHIQLFSTGLPLEIRIHSLGAERRHGECRASVKREWNGTAWNGTAWHGTIVIFYTYAWSGFVSGLAGRISLKRGRGGGVVVLGALDACPLPRGVTARRPPPRLAQQQHMSATRGDSDCDRRRPPAAAIRKRRGAIPSEGRRWGAKSF